MFFDHQQIDLGFGHLENPAESVLIYTSLAASRETAALCDRPNAQVAELADALDSGSSAR